MKVDYKMNDTKDAIYSRTPHPNSIVPEINIDDSSINLIKTDGGTSDTIGRLSLKEIRSEHSMELFHSIEDPREFLDQTISDVNLNELYTVAASCLSSD